MPAESIKTGSVKEGSAWLSHLAVGLKAGKLKVGSFTGPERMAECNEYLLIATVKSRVPDQVNQMDSHV